MRCSTWLAWARYLRLPNVLTVPGDVMAGAALAGIPLFQGRPLAGVTLAYLFGMAFNDVVDRKADGLHRPDRPLPSGQIPVSVAKGATLLLAIASLYAHPVPEMVFLVSTICLYTGVKTLVPILGGFLMSLCRGLAVWIGAGAPRDLSPGLACAIGLWMLFVFGVTRLAEHEETSPPPKRIGWYFPALFLPGFLLLWVSHPGSPVAILPAVATVWGAVRVIVSLREEGAVRPSHTGSLLMLLFPLQATVLFLNEAWWGGLMVLALAPLLRLSRKFVPPS